MSETGQKNKAPKKVLENPFLAGMVVPTAVVLVAALIIWGVTKMLSVERGYKDLIREMNSKTFGNRWVAALELSKYLVNNKIKEADKPWVIQNLEEIFTKTEDERTKNYIILALASMKDERVIPTLHKGLKSTNKEIQFNAVVGLGNMPLEMQVDLTPLREVLKSSKDAGLMQAAVYALAHRKISWGEKEIVKLLSNHEPSVRFAAAIALINYKSKQALPTLRQVLGLNDAGELGFDAQKIENLKLSLLKALERNRWNVLRESLNELKSSENLKVSTRAQEILLQPRK